MRAWDTPQARSAERPLAGMRVIELSSYVASPLTGMTLAQLGADVIRIDPIGGAADLRRWPLAPSGRSIYWAELNRGKRSVTIDLTSVEGRRLVADLVASSGPGGGIVLSNAGPRPGLRYEDLLAERPDLIYIALAGRRDGGTAVDYVVNASLGFPYITGPDEQDGPVNHALPVWDVVTALYLVIALLAAERSRDLSGRGGIVSVALADVALATAGALGYLGEAELGAARPRIGNHIYGMFGRDFTTADGVRVMVVALTARHWRDLLAATKLTELVDNLAHYLGADFTDESVRYTHRELLAALLSPWFAARDYSHVAEVLGGTSVLWSRYRSFAEVAAPGNDEFAKNPMAVEMNTPGLGRYHVLGPPLVFDGNQAAPLVTPALGEHTDAVLAELLQLDATTIADLRARRVVGEPRS
jgi:2-methylfumaryl-CoA isomerase